MPLCAAVCFSWYHGRVDHVVAERLLMESGNVDAFLVRESVTHPGDYTIEVRCHDDSIMRVRVDYKVRQVHYFYVSKLAILSKVKFVPSFYTS